MKQHLQKLTGMLLALVMALSLAACTTVDDGNGGDASGTVENGATIGEGGKTFSVEVVDAEGNVTAFTVKTDEQTVGAALLALGVIAGEEGQYGLYVKTVNGITADYEKDGTYWAFYVDGAYAMTGVDQTDITDGGSYSLKVEK